MDARPDDSLATVFAADPVSESLAKMIRALEPGARLPSERELATQLGVSRTLLRDRLGILEGLGMLRRRTGSGTYVEALKPDALALALNLAISSSHLPLGDLESVRIGLERQAAAESAQRAQPVLLGYMRQAVQTMRETTERQAVLEADRMFHQCLLRAAGNPALTFFADALADVLNQDLDERSHRLRDSTSESPSQALLVERHLAICEAIESGDPKLAMEAVDNHFNALPSAVH
ncbi:FadR/GntR family transcriptional regulator [Nocardioides sp. Soil796]|uniref:FadR/GntR family transcriptional regulator n=1 Tax=Nocardioides sp. Soil796 TaxID=1736412 RepID=UPI0007097C58|nr:FCD domain-containing protein [Nocardioides sp. Soil796]KRF16859.1 hypothetical protein ASH02_02010 [Nocardioides sp. Soil796]